MRTAAVVKDEIHELEIKMASLELELAVIQGYGATASYWKERQKHLIAQRSPAQVARMEAALDRALETF